MSALLLGLGLATLSFENIKSFKYLILLALGCIALPIFQLIPLPSGAANDLPGHEIVAAIDKVSGFDQEWRPLTLAPSATRNALWALLIPLATLILAIQLPSHRLVNLASVVLIIGGVSAFLALIQLLGDPYGSFYFYDTTNNGSAVGVFANRNHQAAFLACLPPLAFAVASSRAELDTPKRYPRTSKIDALFMLPFATVLFVVPLILVTGSRSGLVLCALGIVCIPFISVRRLRAKRGGIWAQRMRTFGALFGAAGMLTGLTIVMQRSVALERLLSQAPGEDMRVKIMPIVEGMIVNFWPLGSGLGSFEKVYQIHEPAHLLGPSYVNHAHNDWMELLLTGGVGAQILMLIGCMAWAGAFWENIFSPAKDELHPLRTAGLVMLLILGMASLTDYPLRTPALLCLFVLSAVWAAMPSRRNQPASISER